MIRFLWVFGLLALNTVLAAEPVEETYFWKEIVPDASFRMYLASEDVVVCYAGRVSQKDFFVLTRSKETFSIRRVAIAGWPEKPHELAPGVPVISSISDIVTDKDGSDVRVAWLQSVDNIYTIRTLTIGSNGGIAQDEIKTFPKNEPVFRLQMHALEPGDLLFFYVYYSEKYLSPISDTGDIAKIWALRWRAGKSEFDQQLSARGQVQNSEYQLRRLTDKTVDLAWTEDRHGVFGYRHRFGTGRLTLTPERPRFQEIAHVSPLKDDESRRVESITLEPIAADDKGNSLPVISIRQSTPTQDSQPYRIFSLEGAALSDFNGPRSSQPMSYDDKTRLWRYLDRPLYRGSKPTPGEQQIHWTDFGRRRWTEKIVLQTEKVAHLIQAPGDCFYWLEGVGDSIKLKKACRH